MLKKVALIGMAIVGIIALFQLPKSLVQTKNREVAVKQDTSAGSEASLKALMEASHNQQPTRSETEQVLNWTKAYNEVVDKEKKRIFADSIANYYGRFHQYDSVFRYRERAALLSPATDRWVKAGDAAMQAADFVADQDKVSYLEKARTMYDKALTTAPNNPNIRTKKALTYVATDNPMTGIKMLQDVVKEYPENEEALYNLGYLSIQSGQFQKALGRLEKLTEVNPEHAAGTFYLGYCYSQLNNKEKALEYWNRAKKLDLDPEFQEIIDSYIKEIK